MIEARISFLITVCYFSFGNFKDVSEKLFLSETAMANETQPYEFDSEYNEVWLFVYFELRYYAMLVIVLFSVVNCVDFTT